jgi:hypothetical protein
MRGEEVKGKRCPNLVEWIEWVILLCEKGKNPGIPNDSELHQYCKSNNYINCPFFAKLEESLSNADTTYFNRRLT